MTYYLIISLPFLIFFTRLLLTNFIVPYGKKRTLYLQMQTRLDWSMLESIEATLKTLFKGDHAKITSIIYRNVRRITDKEFIYGEIDVLSFHNILEKADPLPGDIFYDLGSGTGKAVFTAALFFDFSKSCGIELLPPLYEKANHQLKKATHFFQNSQATYAKEHLAKMSTIQFINGSFLTCDCSDANILYIAATCLKDQTWESLIQKMATLSPGTRIIVATKSIHHERFEMMYQGIELMSWGLCPVTIYKIKNDANN